MSNITELQSSLVSVLSDNFPDIRVAAQYPGSRSPIPAGKPFISVGVKKFEQNAEIDRQQMSVTVYLPFSSGSEGCLSYIDQITELVEQAGLDGYQSITAGEVKYDSRHDFFYITALIVFSAKGQPVSFGGTEIVCPSDGIKIVCARQLAKKFSPFVGEVVQDLGVKARIITCSCELTASQYQTIYRLFSEGGEHMLAISREIGLKAVLSTLSVNSITEDRISCRLIFTEVAV